MANPKYMNSSHTEVLWEGRHLSVSPENPDWEALQETGLPIDPYDDIEDIRAAAILEVERVAQTRVQAHLPTWGHDRKHIYLLRELYTSLGSPSAAMVAAKDIVVYAQGKINQAQTATRAQLLAYDPWTDPNFPS